MPVPFGSATEHLQAEFGWLDRVLWVLLQRFHEDDSPAGAQGWFMPRRRVEALLAPEPEESEDLRQVRDRLRAGRDELDARCARSAEAGVELPLAVAAERLGLSPAERLCLLACLAAEVNAKYGRAYGYLQDDMTRKLPTLGLVEDLARESGLPGSSPVSLSSPLWRWGAVFSAEPEASSGGRMHQGLQLDRGLRAFLLGESPEPVDAVSAPVIHREIVRNIVALSGTSRGRIIVEFHGRGAEDARTVSASVAGSLGLPLIELGFAAASQADELTRAMLEGVVRGAAVFAGGLASVPAERLGALLEGARRVAADGPPIVFLQLERPWLPADLPSHVTLASFELPLPEYADRLAHWQRALAPDRLTADELAFTASRYRLPFAEIDEMARGTRVSCALRGGSAITLDDITRTCRLRSRSSLGKLAQPIAPSQTWDSLVLPPASVARLRDICAQVRRRARVLHDWGFDARSSTGRGLYVLFTGPSGTGKTLAARVVARELDAEVLKVDLSAVVSKYIGETEKNLEQVFEAAERADAILFFDEADALFGKRSEVKDAHDRYANIEINFLLQRLEEFEGVAILATYFTQNIDEAFARRIHLSVEFPFPDERSRLAIWQTHLPERTPVSPGLDLPLMARHFEISGGNIRNVVWNAAFLAAGADRPLGMEHLLEATQREYEKIGKPYRPAELPVAGANGKER